MGKGKCDTCKKQDYCPFKDDRLLECEHYKSEEVANE
jgi:hypothetical protein